MPAHERVRVSPSSHPDERRGSTRTIHGRMTMQSRGVLVVVPLSLVLVACGAGSEEASPETSDRVRTVEVAARDDLRFDPASIEVSAGETVRFVVTNAGSIPHDFYVGTEAEQMAHAAEMGGMDHDADPDADAVTLEAGETDELTVTFDAPGVLLYGCHQPGHYDGGMVGTITVT
jgi:uncharacterized cupredoxin-like copper-binding protein